MWHGGKKSSSFYVNGDACWRLKSATFLILQTGIPFKASKKGRLIVANELVERKSFFLDAGFG